MEYGMVEVTTDEGCVLDGKDEDTGISWLQWENVLEHGLGGAERPVLWVTIRGCEIGKDVDGKAMEWILPKVRRDSFDVSRLPVACFFACCTLAHSAPRLSDVFFVFFSPIFYKYFVLFSQ